MRFFLSNIKTAHCRFQKPDNELLSIERDVCMRLYYLRAPPKWPLPFDLTLPLLPEEREGALLPTEREGVPLPIEREGVLLPTEREGVLLPTEREGVLLPTEREGVLLPTEREGLLLPTEREGVLSLPTLLRRLLPKPLLGVLLLRLS